MRAPSPPPTCGSTIGMCRIMRTCECCGRVFGTRSAKESHRIRACRFRWPVMIPVAAMQHLHWEANHTHDHEQYRNRHNLVTERRAR